MQAWQTTLETIRRLTDAEEAVSAGVVTGRDEMTVLCGPRPHSPALKSSVISAGAGIDGVSLTTVDRCSKVCGMGFFSRMLIPRSVRRAAHPVRTMKSAVTPKPIKSARRALNPVDNVLYGVERSLNTKRRGSVPAAAYRHGSCPVRHRTPEAAHRCRNK